MLTKSEIFKIIGEITGVSHKDVKTVFDAYTNIMMNELKDEGKIKLPDIGTFKITLTRGRIARNPITGQSFETKPKAKVKFVPTKAIKETVAKVKWKYSD